ncbi:acyl-CoA thioester hydrolase/BAAT C-terminal domain-containing protein [Halogeometricum sp. CBA1124]|uniref:acyl-CoA thioester hydrolase/BAAT C-terminal domain-containing protein n=1 Tax=Halogeometricum sp. CBA1124 TaxID=2668071 RepID=UPI00142929D6|nr:acyl-CoA thioester hydrolase/BAAT C-terminal domain-containing protein [Halogeometricum sp. CBA1124]MUV57478.1 hypothetical protein [Halogeometricum sp. CBA1124]
MSDSTTFSRRTVLRTLSVAAAVAASGCQSRQRGQSPATGSDDETAAGAASTAETDPSGPSLELPEETRIADPLPVTASGLEPGATVELSLRPTDPSLESYRWRREYTADDGGRVEAFAGATDERREPRMMLASLAASSGDDSDSSGGESDGDADPFRLGDKAVLDLRAELRRGGSVVAAATTTRVARSPESRGRTADADSLVGTVYEPPGDGPHPPVVVLHGSAGVVPEEFCHMLATQGYWTLGLRYFGPSEQLPDGLANVPMAYFERAVEWAASRSATTDAGVGLVGLSRGVEPALATAAARDGHATVVGYSGSGVFAPGYEATERIPWTRDGEPVASLSAFDDFWTAYENADCESAADCTYDRPREPCDAVACGLDHVRTTARDAYDALTIPVAEIDGPVTLLTGEDDGLWDAPLYSEFALSRLVRSDHDQPFGHHAHEGAGHVFHRPYHANLLRGGTRAGNAAAAVRSWVRTLDTLEAGLRRRGE